jgi:hypothetical protein
MTVRPTTIRNVKNYDMFQNTELSRTWDPARTFNGLGSAPRKLQVRRRESGMEAGDVMVSIVTNTDADWSFGNGRAQFLTGEL